MKRIICVMLSLVILVTLPISVFAAQTPDGAELQYVNATSPIVNFSIDSSGNATIKLNCTGKSTVTKITAKTYVEKNSGGIWARVNVGTANNILTYTVNSSSLIKTYNKSMTGSGSYPCTTTFTLYASTTETIRIIKYASY